MFFGLRDYQLEGAQFLLDNPKAALFFDCGLGKTLTSLAAIHHRPDMFLPALVVAPLRVAKHVWPTEIDDWGFDLTHKVIHGRDKAGQLDRPTDLTMINPEGLKCITDWYEEGGERFKSVICDESTYFKNWESKRWGFCRAICDAASRVAILSGTPMSGRGHLDLWAQFDLLKDNPLGGWHSFCERHFTFDMYDRPRLRKGSDDVIHSAIAPVTLRKAIDQVSMPGLVEVDTVVDMPSGARRAYRELKLEENSYAPLRTLASGFVYAKHWDETTHAEWHHVEKITALKTLIEEIRSPIIIFAGFIAEMDRIVADLGAARIDEPGIIDRWNAGKVPLLVMHPKSGGHGLNLQKGGNHVIWSSLPDSGELYTQAVARVYRSGQKADTVFVHRIIAEDTIDSVIAGLIKRKCLDEKNLFAALAGR